VICFDTETTGLVQMRLVPLDRQPEITEFFSVSLETEKEYGTLIKPTQPISDKIKKITGIDDELVADAPGFRECLTR